MHYSASVIIALCLPLLCACAETQGGAARNMEPGGFSRKHLAMAASTVTGAVTGGVLGSTLGGGAGQVAGVIGGSLLGGVLGSALGDSLDEDDRAAYDHASQSSMHSGKIESWSNRNTGHHGSIVPQARYRDADGRYCREYSQTIHADGRKEVEQGTACRAPDGSWVIDE